MCVVVLYRVHVSARRAPSICGRCSGAHCRRAPRCRVARRTENYPHKSGGETDARPAVPGAGHLNDYTTGGDGFGSTIWSWGPRSGSPERARPVRTLAEKEVTRLPAQLALGRVSGYPQRFPLAGALASAREADACNVSNSRQSCRSPMGRVRYIRDNRLGQ